MGLSMDIKNIPVIGKIFEMAHNHLEANHNRKIIEVSNEQAMEHFVWTEEDLQTAQEVLSEAYAIQARDQIEIGHTPMMGQRLTGPELSNILQDNEELVGKLYARDMQVKDMLAYNSLQPNQVRAMLQSNLPEYDLPEQDGNDLANG